MSINTFLITGGTGFFGRALLRHWMLPNATPPQRVIVISRRPNDFLKAFPEFNNFAPLELFEGDILKPENLPNLRDITHVIHAATDSTSGPTLPPLARFEQIFFGTENILKYAISCGAKRFLLASSGGVYGAQPQHLDRIKETYFGMPDPLNSSNAYSIAKRTAEHLCVLYQENFGLEVIIARCFAFVGRDLPLDVHFAIGNFIRDAIAGTEIKVSGDGSPIRSYMDQRDLAEWLIALVINGRNGVAYNVGSDQPISIRDLAYLVRDCINPSLRVEINNNKNIGSFRNLYVPNTDLAMSELGLKINFDLSTSIIDTVDELKL